jgi:flagellar basal-body rod protein FlgB
MADQNLALMKAMLQKMAWQDSRQKALSQNIANADTPGYKPQDVAPPDFKDLLKSSTSMQPVHTTGLATTNPKHISSGETSGTLVNATAKNDKNPYETSPSGNAVVLEEQLMKMNENMTDHQFISNLYQKNFEMLKASTK